MRLRLFTLFLAAVAGHEWKTSFWAVILHYWIYLSYSFWQGWCWKAKTCWSAFLWIMRVIPVQPSSPNSSVCWSMRSTNEGAKRWKWLSTDSSCWFRALLQEESSPPALPLSMCLFQTWVAASVPAQVVAVVAIKSVVTSCIMLGGVGQSFPWAGGWSSSVGPALQHNLARWLGIQRFLARNCHSVLTYAAVHVMGVGLYVCAFQNDMPENLLLYNIYEKVYWRIWVGIAFQIHMSDRMNNFYLCPIQTCTIWF